MRGNYNYYQIINDILCNDVGVKIIQELDSLYYKILNNQNVDNQTKQLRNLAHIGHFNGHYRALHKAKRTT